jgi:hypothetical protein
VNACPNTKYTHNAVFHTHTDIISSFSRKQGKKEKKNTWKTGQSMKQKVMKIKYMAM